MKRLFSILFLIILSVTVQAATVTGNLADSFGIAYSPWVRFIPLSTPMPVNTRTVLDVPVGVKPDTNGAFSVYLIGGFYDADAGTPNKKIRIRVPLNDTNTYTFNDAANFAASAAQIEDSGIISILVTTGMLASAVGHAINTAVRTNFTDYFYDQTGTNLWRNTGSNILDYKSSSTIAVLSFLETNGPNMVVTGAVRISDYASSPADAVPLTINTGSGARKDALDINVRGTKVTWFDADGVLHQPSVVFSDSTTITNDPSGGSVFSDSTSPTKKAKIAGGVYTGDAAGLTNLQSSALSGTVSYSTTSGTVTNVPLANAITNGGITTNQFATLLLPPERRTSGLKQPTIRIDLWGIFGPNAVEQDYWDKANVWYTNGFYKIWPDAAFLITEGWQGGRDGSGNIYESAAKFPHGLAFTVNVLKTNGFAWVGAYTEFRTNTTGNPTLPVGSLNYIQQDASNYVRMGMNYVRADNPPSYTPGDTTWNLRTAFYAQQMRYWMDFYSGYPTWISSSGWNPTNNLQTLGAVDAWHIVGLLGDAGATVGQPALISYWTNYWPHLRFSAPYFKHAARGCFQEIESAQVGLNSAYWKINLLTHGVLDIPQPYYYSASQPQPYSAMTNVMMKAVLQDPLFQMPSLVVSNVNSDVWVEDLANGDRAVFMINYSTNATVNVGFDARDIRYTYGAQLQLTELEFGTNVFITGTFTNPIPPMTALLYRVKPGLFPSTLAPSSSMKTPEVMFNPYGQNGPATTEAQLISYAQILNTNGWLSPSTPIGIIIPVGWQAAARDANGNLSADATRFPDGLAQTVAYMRTNGAPGAVKIGLQTAFGATLSGYIGLGGPLGDNQYMAQDFSNYFALIKPDFLEIDYPDGTGARGRNAALSTYDSLAQSTWQGIAGSSIPIFTHGFDTNTTPVSPSGINEFTVQGSLDLSTQAAGWTSLIKLMGYFNDYQASAANGVWQSLYVQPVTLGPGYLVAGLAMHGHEWFTVPHVPGPYSYLETNKYAKRITYDPLASAGRQIISNSTYSVWLTDLSGSEKLVSIFNPSTSGSVSATLTASDIGFPPNTQLLWTDIILDTNAPSVTGITTTVTNLSAAGFLVKPVAISTSASMSAALATLGSTVGSVLYVGTDQLYHTLTPGTAGQALQTLGAGVAPIWGDVTNGIATNIVWTAATATVGVNTNGQTVSPYVATNSVTSNLLAQTTWTGVQFVIQQNTNNLMTVTGAQALTNNFDTTAAVNAKTNLLMTITAAQALTNNFDTTAAVNAKTNLLMTIVGAQALTNNFDTQASVNGKTNTVATDLRAERVLSTNLLNTALVAKILQATNDLAAATTNQYQPKIGQVSNGWLAGQSNSTIVLTRNGGALTNLDGGQLQVGSVSSNSIAGSTIGTNKLDASFYAYLTAIAAGSSPTFAQVLSGTATLVSFVIGNSATLAPSGTGLIYANRVIGTQTNSTTGSATAATWGTNVPNGGNLGGLLITTNSSGTRIGTTAGMLVNDVGNGYNLMAAPLTNTAWTTTALGNGSSSTNQYLAGNAKAENLEIVGALSLSTITVSGPLTATSFIASSLLSTNVSMVRTNFQDISTYTNQPMPVINVLAAPYNADPNGSNDATAAIQAALDVAYNSSSTTVSAPRVFVPQGLYKIIGTLHMHRGQILEGESGQSSFATTLGKTNIGPMVMFDDKGCEVRNIKFVSSASSTGAIGIQSSTNIPSTPSIEATIRNCRFQRLWSGAYLNYAWIWQFENCQFENCGAGIDASNQVNSIKVAGGHFIANTNGIMNYGGLNFSWDIQSTFEQNFVAISNYQSTATSIHDSFFELNKMDLISIGDLVPSFRNSHSYRANTNLYFQTAINPFIGFNNFDSSSNSTPIVLTTTTRQPIRQGNVFQSSMGAVVDASIGSYVLETNIVAAGMTATFSTVNVSNHVLIGDTTAVITAITPTANTFPTRYATDVVTPWGTGGYVRWDGSNWRTVENRIQATADIPTFIVNAYEAGTRQHSRVGFIEFCAEEQTPSVVGFPRTLGTGTGASVGNWGPFTSYGNAGSYALGTTALQYMMAYNGGLPTMTVNRYYSIAGRYATDAPCDATDTYWAWVGLRSTVGTAAFPADCAMFVYDRFTNSVAAINGAAPSGASTAYTNNWLAVTGVGSSYTVKDTGLPVVTDASALSGLQVTLTNGAALFYTNGVLATTITATQPTAIPYIGAGIARLAGTSNSRKLVEAEPYLNIRHASRTLP